MSDCEMSSDLVVVHIYINIMQKLLESSLMIVKDKVEQIKIVEVKEKEVRLAITNVLESICTGMMKNKVTSTNPTHVEAEEEAMKAIYQLDKAKSKKAAVQSEVSVMKERSRKLATRNFLLSKKDMLQLVIM